MFCRYAFLVYNASLVYWRCARPLMRVGTYKYLVPSLDLLAKALDEAQDDDFVWRTYVAVYVCFPFFTVMQFVLGYRECFLLLYRHSAVHL